MLADTDAIEVNVALIRRKQAGEKLEQGGLARPVRPQQGIKAAAKLETDLIDGT